MSSHDYFSSQADTYARHRPTYPAALYAWLAQQTPRQDLAWDAGCGNGQAATATAEHFSRVVASDPNRRQLDNARTHPRVEYRLGAEVLTDLASGSVDLITVAQALHWFDREAFYGESQRVLRPGGLLAVWTYNLLEIAPAVDAVIEEIYRGLAFWWPPERRHVEDGYAAFDLPGEAVAAPPLAMSADWTLPQLQGYLSSWSAVAECRRSTGRDAVADSGFALTSAWGDPGRLRTAIWPLTILASRLPAR